MKLQLHALAATTSSIAQSKGNGSSIYTEMWLVTILKSHILSPARRLPRSTISVLCCLGQKTIAQAAGDILGVLVMDALSHRPLMKPVVKLLVPLEVIVWSQGVHPVEMPLVCRWGRNGEKVVSGQVHQKCSYLRRDQWLGPRVGDSAVVPNPHAALLLAGLLVK